jgi:hypothetical protein
VPKGEEYGRGRDDQGFVMGWLYLRDILIKSVLGKIEVLGAHLAIHSNHVSSFYLVIYFSP